MKKRGVRTESNPPPPKEKPKPKRQSRYLSAVAAPRPHSFRPTPKKKEPKKPSLTKARKEL